jgi:predicted ATPase
MQDKDDTKGKIYEALNRINPAFRRYGFNLNSDFNLPNGDIELCLSERKTGNTIVIKSGHISDGTLRFLCLMIILLNPERGRLVCIDEPEVGLHPDMLMAVSEAIGQAAKTSQVFVATHSEHILNQFSISDIKIMEKDETNATVIKTYQENDFEGWYDTYLPGNMWRQGDLGGNRY